MFPGIEFLSDARGKDPIHIIGIFAEDADISYIWGQIENRTNIHKIKGEGKKVFEVYCDLTDTCNLVHELGGIVTIHAGSKACGIDKISNSLPHYEAQKEDISKVIDVYDMGKEEDLEGYRKYVFPSIGRTVPMIMCSDNHNVKKYIRKQICWIKADTSFDGLKQILYEPEERVCIQTTRPDDKSIYQVIDSVTLQEDDFWNDTIFLNPNLNTIIGGRSTGKSSLLKAIAAKHGSKEVEANDFIMNHLDGVSIQWQDGTDQIGREIDYFKQSYMHDIASDKAKTNKLVENIIRNKDTDGHLQKYYDAIKETTKGISQNIFQLFQTQKELVEKGNELRSFGKKEGVQQQIELLKAKAAELQKGSKITAEDQISFEAQTLKLKECSKAVESAEYDLKVLESLLILTPFDNSFEEKYQTNTLSFKLNQSEFAREFKNLKIAAEKDFEALVRKYIESTKAAKEAILKQKQDLLNSESYKKGLASIEGNKELKDINVKVIEEEKTLSSIELCQSQFETLKNKRNAFFSTVVKLHCTLKAAAEEVARNLQISYDGLEINVILNHHKEQLQQFLEARLNQRGYERQDYLATFVRNYDSDNKTYITDILKQLLAGELQLKNSNSAQNVATELLAQSWYSLSYELSYQGDSFKQMSEGKQAFVILKLLLEFSDKKCPILIDQPEDSLDNRAIYNELVAYIKKKKKERQIILVTHNSNVVVSADAENVIVANQRGNDSHNKDDIRFQYLNGALEFTRPKNPRESIVLYSQGIREHVCDILEGGRDAFEKREQKYGFRR